MPKRLVKKVLLTKNNRVGARKATPIPITVSNSHSISRPGAIQSLPEAKTKRPKIKTPIFLGGGPPSGSTTDAPLFESPPEYKFPTMPQTMEKYLAQFPNPRVKSDEIANYSYDQYDELLTSFYSKNWNEKKQGGEISNAAIARALAGKVTPKDMTLFCNLALTPRAVQKKKLPQIQKKMLTEPGNPAGLLKFMMLKGSYPVLLDGFNIAAAGKDLPKDTIIPVLAVMHPMQSHLKELLLDQNQDKPYNVRDYARISRKREASLRIARLLRPDVRMGSAIESFAGKHYDEITMSWNLIESILMYKNVLNGDGNKWESLPRLCSIAAARLYLLDEWLEPDNKRNDPVQVDLFVRMIGNFARKADPPEPTIFAKVPHVHGVYPMPHPTELWANTISDLIESKKRGSRFDRMVKVIYKAFKTHIAYVTDGTMPKTEELVYDSDRNRPMMYYECNDNEKVLPEYGIHAVS